MQKFAAFLVRFSRSGNTLSIKHVENQVSSVNEHYCAKTGRSPGRNVLNEPSVTWKKLIRGLKTVTPLKKSTKLPLVPNHLNLIKQRLNLETQLPGNIVIPIHRILGVIS